MLTSVELDERLERKMEVWTEMFQKGVVSINGGKAHNSNVIGGL